MLLIAVYFRRIKINHDSHEFILESGTVANRYKEVFKRNGMRKTRSFREERERRKFPSI
jgi:hypothetical protein